MGQTGNRRIKKVGQAFWPVILLRRTKEWRKSRKHARAALPPARTVRRAKGGALARVETAAIEANEGSDLETAAVGTGAVPRALRRLSWIS
jgi:hypothetical protein